ncbi:MAG TPA: NAD(P)/FAD-dependent oxidoreductase [Acidobacteriota bacterium]
MPGRRAAVAVVGGGITGLDLAYRLTRRGHRVTLFEKDAQLGGLAGSFDLHGRRLEKFYHFICRPDAPYFERLKDLGLLPRLRWRRTRMGYYLHGRFYDFSTPWSLLKLDQLSLAGKLRYGLNVLRSRLRRDWSELEDRPADRWLRSEIGDEAYDLLWSSLMELKFQQYAPQISAAWLWTRIQRIAASRRLMLFEELGYLDGGSDILVEALRQAIEAAGGTIRTRHAVRDLVVRSGRVAGVVTGAGEQRFDAVLSTVPLQLAARWPALPAELRSSYLAIVNLGVICSILVLDRPLTDVFWLSINDAKVPLAGAIEYSNLNPLGGLHVVYVPEYLPAGHPRFTLGARVILDEHIAHLARVRPEFNAGRVVDAHLFRAELSQPVYTTGFTRILPPLTTALGGFYAADTSHFFPNDRSIAESIALAGRLERTFLNDDSGH